jgi:DHA2 family multidrug resistance protein
MARRSQFHQVHLVSRMATDDPTFQEQVDALAHRLADAGLGTVEGQRQAYARLYTMVENQASALAYVDTFWFLALATGLMFGLSLFLKKNDARAGGHLAAH